MLADRFRWVGRVAGRIAPSPVRVGRHRHRVVAAVGLMAVGTGWYVWSESPVHANAVVATVDRHGAPVTVVVRGVSSPSLGSAQAGREPAVAGVGSAAATQQRYTVLPVQWLAGDGSGRRLVAAGPSPDTSGEPTAVAIRPAEATAAESSPTVRRALSVLGPTTDPATLSAANIIVWQTTGRVAAAQTTPEVRAALARLRATPASAAAGNVAAFVTPDGRRLIGLIPEPANSGQPTVGPNPSGAPAASTTPTTIRKPPVESLAPATSVIAPLPEPPTTTAAAPSTTSVATTPTTTPATTSANLPPTEVTETTDATDSTPSTPATETTQPSPEAKRVSPANAAATTSTSIAEPLANDEVEAQVASKEVTRAAPAVPPKVAISCPTDLAPGIPATFAATVSDADGDDFLIEWRLNGVIDENAVGPEFQAQVEPGDRVDVVVTDFSGQAAVGSADLNCDGVIFGTQASGEQPDGSNTEFPQSTEPTVPAEFAADTSGSETPNGPVDDSAVIAAVYDEAGSVANAGLGGSNGALSSSDSSDVMADTGLNRRSRSQIGLGLMMNLVGIGLLALARTGSRRDEVLRSAAT